MYQIRLLFASLLFFALQSVSAQTWSPMGTGVNDQVNALAVLNGELYAAGKFSIAGGTSANRVAKWNGTGWSALGSGIPWSETYALAVHNNELYAAYTTGTIYKWNGVAWVNVAGPISAGWLVSSMVSYNGDLFIGSEDFVMKNNGSASFGLVGNSATLFPRAFALAVHNGELYAGGDFISIGGVSANGIAKWNGTTWSALGTGVSNGTATAKVSAITAYNGELYVAGTFTTAGGVMSQSIAKWNGTTWSALGSGLNGPATALHVYNGNLYVGGYFTSAGPMAVSSFATWNGSAWLPSSAGLNNYVRALTDFNGQVIAAGNFTNILGSPNIAAFTQCTVAPPAPTSVFGNTNPCSGTNQVYYIGPIIPGTSYTWTLPTGWIGSSSTNSISTTPAAGSGSVMVSATNACGSSAPIGLPVVVLPTPSNSITSAGPLTFCEGTPGVTLSVPSGSGYVYQWLNLATPIPGATSNSYMPTISGYYSVKVAAGVCSTQSPVIPISILPSPPTPLVTLSGNVLTASASPLPYQWYRNGNPIANATSQVFTATLSGSYFVVNTDTNGCTAQSAPVMFTLAGINDVGDSHPVRIFPNPNNGVFTARYSARHLKGEIILKVSDVSGRVVYSEAVSATGSSVEMQIDVSHLPSGLYVLRMINEDVCKVESFIRR